MRPGATKTKGPQCGPFEAIHFLQDNDKTFLKMPGNIQFKPNRGYSVFLAISEYFVINETASCSL